MVPKKDKGKGKACKGKNNACSKKDKETCLVQIDLNNLSDSHNELLKLSQPVTNQDVYDNYGYDENDLYEERVNINNAPNIYVELSHLDSDLDSIGVKKSKTVESKKICQINCCQNYLLMITKKMNLTPSGFFQR